jgi:hypothetical protein
MKKMVPALLVITCFSLSVPAYAANPLATDDTGTLGMMKFQVETNAEFGWDRDTGSGTTIKTDSQSLNAVITAGVLDPLDLVLTFPFIWQQVTDNGIKTYDQGGLSDISVALKWRFLDFGPASLAIKPTVTTPSGDHNRGLGAAHPAYSATLISTAEFKPFSISANFGYTRQNSTDADRDTHRDDLWNLSLAGTVEVMTGLLLAAEIGTTSNVNKASNDWPTFISGGVIYSVIDNLDASMGVKVGLTNPEKDLALLPGISFKFP